MGKYIWRNTSALSPVLSHWRGGRVDTSGFNVARPPMAQLGMAARPAFARSGFRQTLSNLFSQMLASGWLDVEPLALPIEFYRRDLGIIEEPRLAEVTLQHALQASGMLINESWCEFFVDQRASVGGSCGRDGAFS